MRSELSLVNSTREPKNSLYQFLEETLRIVSAETVNCLILQFAPPPSPFHHSYIPDVMGSLFFSDTDTLTL